MGDVLRPQEQMGTWRPREGGHGAETGLPGGPSPAVSLLRPASAGFQVSLLWPQPCVIRGFFLGPRGPGSVLSHVCDHGFMCLRESKPEGASLLST